MSRIVLGFEYETYLFARNVPQRKQAKWFFGADNKAKDDKGEGVSYLPEYFMLPLQPKCLCVFTYFGPLSFLCGVTRLQYRCRIILL